MRRSAAPSQLNAAKRARFIVPYKTLNSDKQSVRASGLPHSSEQEPKLLAGEVKTTTAATSASGILSASSSFSSAQVKQTFLPPTFVNRNHVNASQVSYSEPQIKHETDSTNSITEKDHLFQGCEKSGIGCADINKDHDQFLKEQCMQNAQEEQSTSVTLSHKENTEAYCLKDGPRSPLKPCNISRSGNCKAANLSVCRGEFRQPSAPNKNCAASDLPGTVSKETGTGSGTGATNAPESGVKCGYFSVVWCKLSKKKHKKWEGDAVLVTQGRHVTLYDMEGKEIGKGSGYKSSELESLGEDETLRVGGKEIQVMSKLSEEQFKSGKCFAGACPAIDLHCPTKNTISGLFKSFTNPVLARKGEETLTSSVTLSNKAQNVTPRFDPLAPNALVMPQPTAAHQWQYNKHHSAVVDVVVDPYVTQHLRPHQQDGITFLYECVTGMRNYGGTGAILADDMGLGKTLQCIALIWTLLKQGMYGGKPLVKKVLIITPGSLVKNWSLEFRKWLGPERLQVFAVTGDSRVEDYVKTTMYPVLIISYEMFVRGYEMVKTVPFDLVVCDEGHRLKNTAIKTTSLISSLTTRKRIVLSGTPIQNDLQEFFAVVDFCNPGVLGSSAAFRRVYEDPILTSRQPDATRDELELGEERAAELSRLTRLFVLRRTQEINNKYLPPKVEVVLFCRPSSLQTCVYREILRSSVVRSCLMGRGFGAGRGAGSPHLLAIAALKQVCNHPKLIAPKVLKASQSMGQGEPANVTEGDTLFSGLVGPRYQEQMTCEGLEVQHSGKLAALSIILANIFQAHPHDKVVLVSNHTKTLDLLQQFCSDKDYKYVRLDGHTPTAQRQQIVTRFNSTYGQEKIFLLSSKAGGVGLNLVGASRLFLYDIDWNPANDLQAMARVWRDGQKKDVHIYRLLTVGTLEEKVYQRQISKQGLSGAVMDLKASNIQFSQEDLKDLFSFIEGTECETHALLGCQCDGGVAKESSLPPVTPVTVRSCQLGASVANKQVRNLSMAELMDWQHLKGSSQHIQRSLNLENTEQHVSYLFWQKSNADNSSKNPDC